MQFLFGMLMVELIVKATLWWARGWLWVAKWTLRTTWRMVRNAPAFVLAAREQFERMQRRGRRV